MTKKAGNKNIYAGEKVKRNQHWVDEECMRRTKEKTSLKEFK
jgi:hypothetical protein